MYDVHIGLILKRVVDFLFVLIELISLGVTAESLQAITVEEFSQFFHDKVNAVRLNIAGAPQPSFSVVGPDKSLTSFTPVCTDDVITAIARLPDKSSVADPLPVSLMKQVSGEISPFLTELFNRSLSAGHFLSTFKQAFITPALKKPGLDAANVQSCRPISNLPVVSKLLERIVARQLSDYLKSSDLLPSLGFDLAVSPKLLSSACFPTFSRQLIVVMLQPLSY